MKLQKIELTNFRQFKNEKIEFSQDPNKNITIVLGRNTFGKTTLVRAFLWGLYGDSKSFKDKNLLNRDVQNHMNLGEEKEVKVYIELTHKGKDYSICTKQIYVKDISTGKVTPTSVPITSLTISDENGTKPIDTRHVENEISKVLNQDLSDYFFFDGETNKIEEVAKTKNLKNAVSDLVGLKKIEDLRDFYNPDSSSSVTAKLRKKIKIDNQLNSLLYDPQQDYIDALAEKELLENEITRIENEIEGLKGQLEEKESIIRANEGVRDKKQELDDLLQTNTRLTEKRPEKFSNIVAQLNSGNALLKALFARNYFRNNIDKVIEKTSFGTKNSLSHIQVEAIDQLIARGYCLCGTKIENDNDAYKHLVESKMHMEPHDFGKLASDFSSAEASNVGLAVTMLSNIHQAADSLLADYDTIDNNNEIIKKRRSEIDGHPDVSDVQKDADRINRQIGSFENQLEVIQNREIPEAIKKINKCAEELRRHQANDEENKKINEYIKYAEFIYEQASNELTSKGNEVLQRMNQEAQTIFSDMYHGERNISIDEQYHVTTFSETDELEESQGLETVKNYSFVCALLKLVKEKLVFTNSDEENDEDYPLVLDAPFSNTDEQHIANICNIMPKYCDQVIMFVMGAHYNYAESTIADRVGSIYHLDKHSERETTIEGGKGSDI